MATKRLARLKRHCSVIALALLGLFLNGCVVLVPFIESDGGQVSPRADCPLSNLSEPTYVPAVIHYYVPPRDTTVRGLTIAEKRALKIDKLVRDLKHPKDVVRTHAASDLGSLKARGAIGPLAYALKNDRSKWVRRAAAKSLGKIGARAAKPALQRALHDRNKWVAHSAANAIKKLRY
jgi:hypothetical protein